MSNGVAVSERPRLRGGLYQRVSKDPKQMSVSPAQQEKENRAWCEANGIDIAWSITDPGYSASRYARRARPGWVEVDRNLAGADPVDVLVTWECSRMQRDLEVHVELRKLCTDKGRNVLLAYKGRLYDFQRPDDRFTTGLDALLAERESEETRERIMRSVRANVAAGRPHGRLPYGYRSIYDASTGDVVGRVPDKVAGPVVAEIVARVGAAEPGYTIAADLTARGVPSPHEFRSARLGREVSAPYPWTLEQVHRIARNPSYAGLRTHKGKVVGEGTWDAVVSFADHARAVARLGAPGRLSRASADSTAKHLLSGIAVCGVCGSPVRMIKNRGYPSYACWGKPAKRGSACVCRRQLPVDTLVSETIIAWAERPDVMGRLAENQGDDGAVVAAAELVDLEQQRLALADAVDQNRMTVELAGRIEAKLLPRIEDARARSIPKDVPAEVRDLVGPGARHRWENDIDVAERRRIVRALVTVTINKSPYPNGSRGFDPDLIDVVEIDWTR